MEVDLLQGDARLPVQFCLSFFILAQAQAIWM